MENGHSNGAQVEVTKGADSTIILTFTARPWHLQIGGNIENVDCAIAMLQQALRHFEGLQRIEQARALQQQMVRAAEDARIAALVRGKG